MCIETQINFWFSAVDSDKELSLLFFNSNQQHTIHNFEQGGCAVMDIIIYNLF